MTRLEISRLLCDQIRNVEAQAEDNRRFDDCGGPPPHYRRELVRAIEVAQSSVRALANPHGAWR